MGILIYCESRPDTYFLKVELLKKEKKSGVTQKIEHWKLTNTIHEEVKKKKERKQILFNNGPFLSPSTNSELLVSSSFSLL